MIGSITVMDHCTALHSITDTPAGIRTRTYYRSVIGWIESLMESCWAVVLAVTRSSTHIRVDSLSFPSIYSFCVASASTLVMGPRLVILAKSTPQAPHIEVSPNQSFLGDMHTGLDQPLILEIETNGSLVSE
jgi:hypothetical protein